MSTHTIPQPASHKYNTRNKNNPNRKIYNDDISDSDDSSEEEIEEISDPDEENSEDEKEKSLDSLEYKEFLSKLFPSKHSEKRVLAEKRFRSIGKKLLKKRQKNCNIIIGKTQIIKNSGNTSSNRNERQKSNDSLNLDYELSDDNDDAESLDGSSEEDSDNDCEDSDDSDASNESEEEHSPKKKKIKLDGKNLIKSLVKLANQKKHEKEKDKKKLTKTTKKNLKKFKKLLEEKDNLDDSKYFSKHIEEDQQNRLISTLERVNELSNVTKPYRIILLESEIPDSWKVVALKKLCMLENMDPTISEYFKLKTWVDTFMRIPFGKNIPLPIKFTDGMDKVNEYMQSSVSLLNSAVFGLDDAKMQIMQLIGQWIVNPHAIGSAIAIKGPMGTGKTTLVKEGISKILNRPFELIALGGATDSSTLEGHGYTYEGSSWGKIVDILVNTKCSNPIIYFDELDKISDTPKGEEITGILTHLIDSSQNDKFHDKYFSEIDFDLSKALFIFSYNDDSKVNPILRDRMFKITTKGYNKKEKITISKDYLIPNVCKQVLFKTTDIIINDDVLEYIVENYTDGEQGVRNLKRCLEIIFTKLNLYRLMKPDTNLFKKDDVIKVEFPFIVDKKIIDKLIVQSNDSNDNWKRMYM